MMQLDFICQQCPLAECSEESLFCAFRLLSKRPNFRQRVIMAKVKKIKQDRREYFRQRYQRQKEERARAGADASQLH